MKLNPSSVLLLGLGLVFLLAGVGVAVFGAQQIGAAAARVERLSPLARAALDDRLAGQEALLEGRISAQNPALFQDFVAYLREEYRGRGKNRSWGEVERFTPPLLIDLPDGTAALADDQYLLNHPPHTREEPGAQGWFGIINEGATRERGFRAGDPVLALGTLASGREGLVLRAEWLYGGTRAEYLDNQRRAAAGLSWLGVCIALIGLVVGGIGGKSLAAVSSSTSSGRRRGRQVRG